MHRPDHVELLVVALALAAKFRNLLRGEHGRHGALGLALRSLVTPELKAEVLERALGRPGAAAL
eukprot:13277691-Alexandrium_andersonii.AAC.1